jgi:DNA-binding beta-propeller fold protein YncE
MSEPQGIAVDDRYIYVSDTGNNRILVFSKNGGFLVAFGNKGSGRGEFNGPRGISIGRDGHIFIADTNNHRIQEFAIFIPEHE